MPEATPPQARIIFAGGGTGGHIYPALAIAERLRETDPHIEPHFIVSQREVDARVLAPTGFDFTPIPARPFAASPMGLARLIAGWGTSVRAARAAIAGPTRAVLVTTGGFVAPPALIAARAERAPRLLINLDAVPGKANRLAARLTPHRLDTSGADLAPTYKPILPLIRAAARATTPTPEARTSFDLDPDTRTLLVTGGSQGARSINDLLAALVQEATDVLRGWQLIHQTGGEDTAQALARIYASAGIRAHTTPFLDRMGDAWSSADLAVCRAGAGAVAEARASATPALFFPYPGHADNHQRRNAEPLTRAGAALIATDHADVDSNMGDAGRALLDLLTQPSRLEAMRTAYAELGSGNGVPQAIEAIRTLLASA